MSSSTSPAKIFGISNCDTVKKAKKWLDAENISYEYVDFRKDGIQASDVEKWISSAGIEKVINKRGTTWRKLNETQQGVISDSRAAIELILSEPTLIKRPVLEFNDRVEIGFSEPTYKTLFS